MTTVEPNPTHFLRTIIISLTLTALVGGASVPARVFADAENSLSIPFLSQEVLEILEEDTSVAVDYAQLSERQREGVAAVKRHIPKPQKIVVRRVFTRSGTHAVVATAYSSTPDQTDSDPCTTATGFNVCKHNSETIIAANYLPFGTKVRLPGLYGERVFTVADRMNARYGQGRIDIWMKTRSAAKSFGVKRTTLEIVDEQLAAK